MTKAAKRQIRYTMYGGSCPECDRLVRCYIPRGGNGTAMLPYRHKNERGQWCKGRFMDIPTADPRRLSRA